MTTEDCWDWDYFEDELLIADLSKMIPEGDEPLNEENTADAVLELIHKQRSRLAALESYVRTGTFATARELAIGYVDGAVKIANILEEA
jgi:hypothetical protein